MNAPRIRFIRDTLVDLSRQNVKEQRGVDLTGLRAVDVGCGGGLAAESLARLGLRVLGIDAARENVEIARLHQTKDLALAGSDALEYRQITAEQLLADTSNRGNFDAVVSLEVIEHVTDPFTFVRSLVELARPGAPIIVSTMNRTPISYLVDIAVPEYLTRMVPRGTHEHGKFIKPEELRLMLRACGAEMLDVRGLVLDPVTNVCHLVDRDLGLLRDVGVQANYIMAARKNK
ncbi:Hexaprenyldihydroxybenzoate methyltransferase, mitochondrial [Coemansia sp. RSA 2618]|nr:Hexaprenyldihydroxybenzoate methyltransferase, mitochondrial [Coemansia sp. RSA 2618]